MPRSITVQPTGFISPKLDEGRLIDKKGGRAVFAREKIRAKELLVVWGGKVVTGEMLNDMSDDKRLVLRSTSTEDLYLVTANEGPADWVNHSCDPNAGLVGQVVLVAMRDIRVGEEISLDDADQRRLAVRRVRVPLRCQDLPPARERGRLEASRTAGSLRRAFFALRPAPHRGRVASCRRGCSQAGARRENAAFRRCRVGASSKVLSCAGTPGRPPGVWRFGEILACGKVLLAATTRIRPRAYRASNSFPFGGPMTPQTLQTDAGTAADQVLSHYRTDNPGVRANLYRLLNSGRLAGPGKLVILRS